MQLADSGCCQDGAVGLKASGREGEKEAELTARQPRRPESRAAIGHLFSFD